MVVRKAPGDDNNCLAFSMLYTLADADKVRCNHLEHGTIREIFVDFREQVWEKGPRPRISKPSTNFTPGQFSDTLVGVALRLPRARGEFKEAPGGADIAGRSPEGHRELAGAADKI